MADPFQQLVVNPVTEAWNMLTGFNPLQPAPPQQQQQLQAQQEGVYQQQQQQPVQGPTAITLGAAAVPFAAPITLAYSFMQPRRETLPVMGARQEPVSLMGMAAPFRSTLPAGKEVGGVTTLPEPLKDTITVNVPYGHYAQTEIKGAKVQFDPVTGEVGIYQQPYGHSIYNLVASGGRAALQSGMFTTGAPATPIVYTQESGARKTLAASAQPDIAAQVLASPEKYSRLGAEAYGGYVKPLDTRTIQSTGAQLSTYANQGNLARLADPYGVNLGKAAAPGANIPWGISPAAPAISPFGTMVVQPGKAEPAPAAAATPPMIQPLPTVTPATVPKGTGFGAIAAETGDQIGFGTIGGKSEPMVKGIDYAKGEVPGQTIVTTETKPMFFGIDVSPITEPIAGLEKSVRETLNLPAPEVGEKAVQAATLVVPIFGPVVGAGMLATAVGEKFLPGSEAPKSIKMATELFEPMRGQYTQFYEHPVLVPTSYALGAGFGVITEGIGAGLGAVRSPLAIRAISEGGMARTAIQGMDIAAGIAPKVLKGLYAADVAYRVTGGGTEFSPSVIVPRTKGIITQETVPMGIGFALPGQAVKAAKIAEIGYRAAVQEGATTGRFEHFVKQPITRPVELAKIEYKSYVQERAPEKVGIVDYLKYKTIEPAKITVKAAVQEYPENIKGLLFGSERVTKVPEIIKPTPQIQRASQPPASRITGTKVVGGRTVPALSKEPSLQKMGIAEGKAPESTGTLGKTYGYTQDFRGTATGPMKPFTKMATGQIILSEELPMVEGMPATKMPQRAEGGMRFYPLIVPAAPEIIPAMDVIARQQLAFTPESKERQSVMVAPMAVSPLTRFSQGIRFEQVPAQFTGVMASTRQATELGTTTIPRTTTTPVQTPDEYKYGYNIGGGGGPGRRGGGGGGGLWLPDFFGPGPAAGGGGAFKRRAAFMETFRFGLDVGAGFGGRRVPAKRYKSPKKYPQKKKARKKK